MNKCQKIVQIRDAPCRGPQVRSLRCVSNEAKEHVVVSEPIHPQVRIGHAHLRVADLKRATAFYLDVLDFEVMRYGLVDAAFLPAGATTTSGLTPGTAPPGRRRLLRATPACCI